MDFPQFRKLSNEMVFYKILDDRHFEEIQIVGKRFFCYSHRAEKYPEIIKIQDLLEMNLADVHISNEEEFLSAKNEKVDS